jgi:type III secretion protein C
LKELVKNLDIPLKQVFIEVLVLQTSLANGLTFGLEWGANYKYRNKFSGNTYNTVGPPQTTNQNITPTTDPFITNLSKVTNTNTPTPQMIPPPSGTFDLGVIGEVIRHNGETYLSLGSLLNALQTDTETAVIMMPKIITQDGKTSTLFSGQNIPFAGSFVNNTGNNATVLTANIEYRDIGFQLTVTPVLGNSDIITLDISLDSSQVIGDIASQQIQNNNVQSVNGIVTTKTTMQTTVHIPNDHFLILSGMVNDSDTKVKQGIPCLGGLPGIGALFSTSADTISNNNVVIFIRPRMINSLEDMRDITEGEEETFRELSGTPFLEHQFNEGMELIKTIDDE